MSYSNSPEKKQNLYCSIKDKTVIVYTKTEPLTDEQLEEMMVDSLPYGYIEPFI
jgi:hypothetical protein